MTHRPTRRAVLATGAAGAAAVGLPRAALARTDDEPEDYRALVCVFLTGGMDAYDTLIPTDARQHAEWKRTRGGFADAYAAQGAARDPERLLPVGTDAEGAPYGLPPQMPRLAAAVREGGAAIVANIGPMQGPVTPRQLEAASVPLPPKLFSHSDQRAYWRELAPASGARTGWGGRLAASFGDQGPFAAVAGGRDEGFTTGPRGPGVVVGDLRPKAGFGTRDALYGDEELAALFLDHLGTASETAGILERDYARQQRAGIDVSRALIAMMRSTSAGEALAAGAKKDTLAYNLAVVAKMIALRARTGARRQVFYVEMNGFDTHRDQPARLPDLQAELDDALAGFSAWLAAAGLSRAVTTFTASDFGRTLVPNGSGTDHGWGGHQIVMGGAVAGGLHGTVPPSAPGHALDAGRGRVIPTLAAEQTAVPLARWLGMKDADLAEVFPYADRFDLGAVPLMAG